MTTIVNYLRRRVFIANRSRIQYISDRTFSTRINPQQLNWRLAKASDFDDVVKLSEGIYNGYDFIPAVFHQWLKRENVAIMMLYADKKLIGLEAGHIIDGGKTLVRRGGRIAPNLKLIFVDRVYYERWYLHGSSSMYQQSFLKSPGKDFRLLWKSKLKA